jgi:hypothetical protein
MTIRTYRELRRLQTIEDRYAYLRMGGRVADPTFGFDRWMNQKFYTSREWRRLRHDIIVRDNGCDLGAEGFEIHHDLVIHHMNPITVDQIKYFDESILDPEYLITTQLRTHNAIHYGDARQLPQPPTVRRPGDTKLW